MRINKIITFLMFSVWVSVQPLHAGSGTRLMLLGKKTSGEINLTLLAGQIGGAGYVDDTGSAARFNSPTKIVVDSGGVIFVTEDSGNRIRKITSGGVTTTFAGSNSGFAGTSGSGNGTGTAATFYQPWGIAKDSSGNLFVADRYNSKIRTVTNPGAVVADLAGGSLSYPTSVAVDGAGNVYTTDSWQIFKITGGVATVLAGGGSGPWANGTGAAAAFNWIGGLTYDSTCNCLYVADTQNHAIRKVTLPGGVVTTLAGGNGTACTSSGCNSGSNNGTGNAAGFSWPYDVATDSSGNVYVADQSNCTIRKVTSAGAVTTFAGTAGTCGNLDGTGSAAKFSYMRGIGLDSSNNIYVADTDNHNIRKITTGGVVTTLAGPGDTTGNVDATGSLAKFNYPKGIGVDSAGNVFVADLMNSSIRKITSAGVVTTFAGGTYGEVDGTGAAATFGYPWGLFIDSVNNIWTTTTNGCTLRKITTGAVVTTFAGTGFSCSVTNGTGSAARFYQPNAVTGDSSGNLFVVDTNGYTVRKVTTGAVVTTLAGGSYGSNNGTGAAAQFTGVFGAATDASGNVFVPDNTNCTIRKITPAGVVTTFAGSTGVCSTVDGTGAGASFTYPKAVAFDGSGNLYVAEMSTIRKVTPAGVVTTVIGVAGQLAIVLGAAPGRINQPEAIAIRNGVLYIVTQNAILKTPVP